MPLLKTIPGIIDAQNEFVVQGLKMTEVGANVNMYGFNSIWKYSILAVKIVNIHLDRMIFWEMIATFELL